MMAKQTFTTGQVLTAAQMTSLQQTAMLGGAANAKVASYVLVAADAGDAITMSNGSATTITVNTGLFAAGDIVTIINLGAGVCTITAGTATVTTSGSLALAQNQGGVLRFTSASAAIFFQFATPASGDIEGVTAGTGISGGGTSGTVTITNSMATEIDAKGDLIVGTGADTFARLAVGTNGHTLVADSSVSPQGLKWAVDPVADVITTAGDLIYGTAADTVARLGIGTAGQVLQVNSGATAPEWAAPAGGGKVLQVVQASTTTQTTVASTNYTDTNLTATITPTSATSTILVMVSQRFYQTRQSTSSNTSLQIVRGATSVFNADQSMNVGSGAPDVFLGGYTTLIYRDSPATTSATTYKTQGKVSNTANSGQILYQENSAPSTITLLEIGA